MVMTNIVRLFPEPEDIPDSDLIGCEDSDLFEPLIEATSNETLESIARRTADSIGKERARLQLVADHLAKLQRCLLDAADQVHKEK